MLMSWHQIASNWLRPKPRDRGKSLGNNMRFRIALGSGATILLKVNHMRAFSHPRPIPNPCELSSFPFILGSRSGVIKGLLEIMRM